MAKVLATGTNDTPVGGLASLTLVVPPHNYTADFRSLEEGPGKIVMSDVTSAVDQPSTLRIAQQSKPNVYVGTSIDSSAFLANKRGTDTILEIKEVWSITDAAVPEFLQLMPARCAITLSLPTHALITDSVVEALVCRAIAALFNQGDATSADGINALLHGVVSRD